MYPLLTSDVPTIVEYPMLADNAVDELLPEFVGGYTDA
jgi:hypothetical protein